MKRTRTGVASIVVQLLLLSGCGGKTVVPEPATVEGKIIAAYSAPSKPAVAFILQTDSSGATTFDCKMDMRSDAYQKCAQGYVSQTEREFFQRLSPVLFRSALMTVPRSVVRESAAKAGSVRILLASITITEFVPDIEADRAAQDRLHSTLGWAVSMTTPYVGMAAGTLGPIGGFIQGFDVLTGIPTGWKSEDKKGVIVAELKLVDPANGTIFLSMPVAGSFGLRMSQYGESTIGSYRRKVESSTPQEALRLALLEAAKLIAEKLNLS